MTLDAGGGIVGGTAHTEAGEGALLIQLRTQRVVCRRTKPAGRETRWPPRRSSRRRPPATKTATKKAARPTEIGPAKKPRAAKPAASRRKEHEFDLALETAKVASMGTDELHDLYEDTFGKPTKSIRSVSTMLPRWTPAT